MRISTHFHWIDSYLIAFKFYQLHFSYTAPLRTQTYKIQNLHVKNNIRLGLKNVNVKSIYRHTDLIQNETCIYITVQTRTPNHFNRCSFHKPYSRPNNELGPIVCVY